MYVNVAIVCEREAEDLQTELLFSYGAGNVSSEDCDGGVCLTVLTRFPNAFLTHYPDATVTPVEDWEYKWMEDYEGGVLIPGVFIKPSDKDTRIPDYVETLIELDPRDAFGDGRHPTTRLCASLMRSIYDEAVPSSVIDIGTGTGILAILAEKWGSVIVDAVDNEPLSVIKTKENCARNNCRLIQVSEGDIVKAAPERENDLVIANILTEVIEASITHIMAACKPGGRIVFSGIGRQWKGEILSFLEKHGLVVEQCLSSEGWLGIKVKR